MSIVCLISNRHYLSYQQNAKSHSSKLLGYSKNVAEGKGIEPLPVTVARGSSPLCHLDATLYLAESTRIELDALTHNLLANSYLSKRFYFPLVSYERFELPTNCVENRYSSPIELIRELVSVTIIRLH